MDTVPYINLYTALHGYERNSNIHIPLICDKHETFITSTLVTLSVERHNDQKIT